MTESPKKIKVLLIEDDPDDILLIRELLSQTSQDGTFFELECVDRLERGLKRLGRGGIDISMLDLTLPDCKGLETVSRTCTQSAETPVVVITVSTDEKVALEALNRGAEDYLVKGEVNAALLSRTLRYAIERHRNKMEAERINRELRASNERLEKLILLDPLTGLLNRRGLQEILFREIHRSQREQTALAVLLIDLDNFKGINDTWGYAVGDTVLQVVSAKLKDGLRKSDYAARVGGDEFMILLPGTRAAEAIRIAERMRLAISGMPILLSGINAHIAASVGVLTEPLVTSSIEELLAQAYPLLHQSKRMGKNRIVHDVPSKGGAETSEQMGVYNELRKIESYRALKQPIVSLGDRRIIGYEFLCRSKIPGLETPDEFLRIAWENNFLTLVDHLCLKCSLKASASLPAGSRIHLNLFPSTILALSVEKLIEDFPPNFPKNIYCVEISEKQIVGEPSYIATQLKAWKNFGVLTALDDVGFGRSSLESLVLLEPSVVKVDKRWVQGIHRDLSQQNAMVRILRIAETLGIEVIGEGIEEEADLKTLESLGVKYGQGYFLGRPG